MRLRLGGLCILELLTEEPGIGVFGFRDLSFYRAQGCGVQSRDWGRWFGYALEFVIPLE